MTSRSGSSGGELRAWAGRSRRSRCPSEKSWAVYIGKLGYGFVEVSLAVFLRLIEDTEELSEAYAEIRPVALGAIFYEELELVRLEDAGVFCEEAEEDSDEETFEIVACIAAAVEGVVQVGHELNGLEVGGVLRDEFVGGVVGDEGKEADVGTEFAERELFSMVAEAGEERHRELVFWLEVVESEAAEVGEQDVAWDVFAVAAFVEIMDIGEGLGLGGFEAFACGLVLDEYFAFPEQVDEAGGTSASSDGGLEGGDEATRDAEDVEELVPEGLLFSLLAGGVLPFAREDEGAVLDFVPGDIRHRP